MAIKLVIFDLDGVLVESKGVHFEALNKALATIDEKYAISHEDHVARYDGKPTTVKLRMLTEERGLHPNFYPHINQQKQMNTVAMLRAQLKPDEKIISTFKALRDAGYRIAVASNSIESTTFEILEIIGIDIGVEGSCNFCIGNDGVKNPKPNPEMYYKCMIHFGVSARETLIVEDSYVGRQAAHNSGAHVYGVNSPADLSVDGIMHQIKMASGKAVRLRWKSDRLNVLIPMAGAGSRFAEAGYKFPKFLINVLGKPMIQLVVDSLLVDAHYIFIVQKEHVEQYNIRFMLNLIAANCDIVVIDGVTDGAARTTLCAKHLIDNDSQLIIANSDQYIEWDSSAFMYAMQSEAVDGGVLTFKSIHPKWSYARVDKNGWISEVVEKNPISDRATCGIYYWKRGSDYVKYAQQMIDKNIRYKGEVYVAPSFTEAINDGKKIKAWDVDEMAGIGDPESLNEFLLAYAQKIDN